MGGQPGKQPPAAGENLQDEVEAAICSPALALSVFGSVGETVQRHLLLHRAHQHQSWRHRLRRQDPLIWLS